MAITTAAVRDRMLINATTVPYPGPIFPIGPTTFYEALAEAFVNTITTPVTGMSITTTYVAPQAGGPAINSSPLGKGPGEDEFIANCVSLLDAAGWNSSTAPNMAQFIWGIAGMMMYVWESGIVSDAAPLGATGSIVGGGFQFNRATYAANALTSMTSRNIGIVLLGVHVQNPGDKYTDPISGAQKGVGEMFDTPSNLVTATASACETSFAQTTGTLIAPPAAPGGGGVTVTARFV